jgi:hypothetical protein
VSNGHRRTQQDPLALFSSESKQEGAASAQEPEAVPPPGANEIDALIDAVSIGERFTDADRPGRTSPASSRGPRRNRVLRGPWALPSFRSAPLRWIVAPLVAFALGAAAVTWMLHVWQRSGSELDPAGAGERAGAIERGTVPESPPAAPARNGLADAQPDTARSDDAVPPIVVAPSAPAESPVQIGTANDRAAAAVTALPGVGPAAPPPAAAAPAPAPSPIPTTTPAAVPNAFGPPLPSPRTPESVMPPATAVLTPPEAPLSSALTNGLPAVPVEYAAPSAAVSLRSRALEEGAVLQTLQNYERAYEAMNVMATAKVWPSVDRRALARAFTTLKSQGLTFESCEVSVSDTSATAHCRGTVEFVRKVGNPVPLTAPQEWRFTMRKFGTDWMIEDVAASQASPASAREPS